MMRLMKWTISVTRRGKDPLLVLHSKTHRRLEETSLYSRFVSFYGCCVYMFFWHCICFESQFLCLCSCTVSLCLLSVSVCGVALCLCSCVVSLWGCFSLSLLFCVFTVVQRIYFFKFVFFVSLSCRFTLSNGFASLCVVPWFLRSCFVCSNKKR